MDHIILSKILSRPNYHMRKLVHKIIVVILTPILLFSTTSFTVEKHYCGEMVCAIGLEGVDFSKNSNENNNLSNHVSCSDEDISCCTGEIDCCSTETIAIKGSTIKKEKEIQIKIEKTLSINLLPVTQIKMQCNKVKVACKYATYSSPLLVKDIIIDQEVFLI